MISATIFSESAAYKDPPKKRKAGQQNPNGTPVEPVKPEDLVKSLNDLDIKSGDLTREAGAGVYLSMNGVMRALFEEVESLAVNEDESATAAPEDPEDAPSQPEIETAAKNRPVTIERKLPADRHQRRLKEELNGFFDKFSSEEFADQCTASKLVQAAAYPLAVALLGERGAWLTAEDAKAIVTRDASISS